MASEWTTKLQNLIDSIPSRVKSTRAIIAGQLGMYIRRYHGGMPAGFMAAIAQFESGGQMVTGDPNLGEAGYFQIAASTPGLFKLAADARLQPEANVYLGGLEYNTEVTKLAILNPLVLLGTPDAWKLARLSFAVGGAGTRKLIDAAQPRVAGTVFSAIKQLAERGGTMALGSQSAEKVAYRVQAVDVIWQIGALAAPGQSSDLPEVPPAPAGLHPVIPPSIVAKMQSARSTRLLTAAALVAAVAVLA